MNTLRAKSGAAALVVSMLFAYSTASLADAVKVTLSGASEVPPVTTMAAGGGTIMINSDMSVSGSVATSGVAGTMAHIHMGATGKNGPVIVHLAKSGDNGWAVPEGAKLTEAQYQAYKAGELYINVHSADNKAGEIRGQLMP